MTFAVDVKRNIAAAFAKTEYPSSMSHKYSKFFLFLIFYISSLSLRTNSHAAKKPVKKPAEKIVDKVAGLNLPVDDLTGKGLVIEVHAAVHDYRQYVGTLRQKDNFFVAEQFPLSPANANVASEFLKLKRHDRIRVKGELVNPRNPQRHIKVTSLEMVKAYETQLPPHHYEIRLPGDLRSSGRIRALVHAVAAGGSVLLIDYRGAIIPVMVRQPNLTRRLYRNDTIQLDYRMLEAQGNRPAHMMIDPQSRTPLRVLYSIVSEHAKAGTREGFLVMFPKSPQVQFNVFALEATNRFSLKHNYTLVNFESAEEFKKIREKLQAVWDAAPQDRIYNARNRLENPRIKITAKGTLNMVDAGQANPQILLKSADDMEFEIDLKP